MAMLPWLARGACTAMLTHARHFLRLQLCACGCILLWHQVLRTGRPEALNTELRSASGPCWCLLQHFLLQQYWESV